MNDPGFFLVVRFWVAPQAESALLGWLDGGHVAEVLRQPGFLWCKRIRLEKAADGWAGYSQIYAIESKAAFDAYNTSPVMERFKRERAPFEKHMRIDRFFGQVD
jgi:quinol monooxygenase YgiN